MPDEVLELIVAIGCRRVDRTASSDGASFQRQLVDFGCDTIGHLVRSRLVSRQFCLVVSSVIRATVPTAASYLRAEYRLLVAEGRYLPRPSTRRRGHGCQTYIDNMSQISATLHATPELCLKYAGCELGAVTRFTEERGGCLNGHHEASQLVEIWGGLRVLMTCGRCGLPALQFTMHGIELVRQCFMCGASFWPSEHRVFVYVQKVADAILKAQRHTLRKHEKKLRKYEAKRSCALEQGLAGDLERLEKKANKYKALLVKASRSATLDELHELTIALHGHSQRIADLHEYIHLLKPL